MVKSFLQHKVEASGATICYTILAKIYIIATSLVRFCNLLSWMKMKTFNKDTINVLYFG